MVSLLNSSASLILLLGSATAQQQDECGTQFLTEAGFSPTCIHAVQARGTASELIRGKRDHIGAIAFEKLPELSDARARNAALLALKESARMNVRMRLLQHLWLEQLDDIAFRDALWQGVHAAGLKIKGDIGPGIEVEIRVIGETILAWAIAPVTALDIIAATPNPEGLLQAYVDELALRIRDIDRAIEDPVGCFALAKELGKHADPGDRECTGIAAAFAKLGKSHETEALLDHVWSHKIQHEKTWTVEDWISLARVEELIGRKAQNERALDAAEQTLNRVLPKEPFPRPKTGDEAKSGGPPD